MSSTFAYVRISKSEQNTENQIKEIESADFSIQPHRIISKTVCRSMPISRSKGFKLLLDKMWPRYILVVTRMDRLGLNAIDISITVAKLEQLGIKVHCLTLGGVDLTSPAGKMTMGVINHVAQFERNLLIEHTQSGLDRTKTNDEILGCLNVLSNSLKIETIQYLQTCKTVTAIVRDLNVSR